MKHEIMLAVFIILLSACTPTTETQMDATAQIVDATNQSTHAPSVTLTPTLNANADISSFVVQAGDVTCGLSQIAIVDEYYIFAERIEAIFRLR